MQWLNTWGSLDIKNLSINLAAHSSSSSLHSVDTTSRIRWLTMFTSSPVYFYTQPPHPLFFFFFIHTHTFNYIFKKKKTSTLTLHLCFFGTPAIACSWKCLRRSWQNPIKMWQIPICLAFYCAPHSQGKYTCNCGDSLHRKDVFGVFFFVPPACQEPKRWMHALMFRPRTTSGVSPNVTRRHTWTPKPHPTHIRSPSGPTRQEEYCFLTRLMIAGVTCWL